MKIAIIGSGISGLTSAWYLHNEHDVTLFEAGETLGGHTATVDVEVDSGRYAIDTGFIVFNDRTYPNFERLLEEIGIGRQKTQMSFSVRNDSKDLEYNGHTISTLFAQKRNWFSLSFYRFLFEIMRFNKLAKQAVYDDVALEGTLGDFLSRYGFSQALEEDYILPMGAAIWSSTLNDMRAFPLAFFLRFFLNHGLLDIKDRPQWYVVPGGSREYIRRMEPQLKADIHLNTPVQGVTRLGLGEGKEVKVVAGGVEHFFDTVIFACHSDQALAMLSDPTALELDILSAMPYQENEVVLHTDDTILPTRREAWASWNYHMSGGDEGDNPTTLTYNMNILQGIDAPETFCVSLNSSDRIAADKILNIFHYSHPVFNTESVAAQQRRGEINGIQQTYFCGAYWYNGFHEDGVRSALDVVKQIRNETQSVAIDSPLKLVSGVA
ncbi:NAD(P)/FAD-dependent oxidoreductase [Thaumasiovibrio subtropicus]|uniref:NAD(P)/FAD-dependent oxidoreductase n=1 Tax=Thaumasiovibrio subtropicus TaxID=1891207 RepID=UPI000B35AB2F|nr:FAD-dependent oxidoreductase [Thaumasiovibrio subtropicus]